MGEISFSELVKPLGEAEFIKHFREKTYVHIKGPEGQSDRFEYLFSWSAINAALSQNLLDDKRLRIARDGRDIPPALYRRDTERKPVDFEKVVALLKQSCSMVINRVQDLSPPVRRLTRQMEARLKWPVNSNSYLSFGQGGAFAMHYDTHDVIVMQVYGRKRWFLYADPDPAPLAEYKVRNIKPPPRPVVAEIILEAGDMIFVPRGMYHRAEVVDTTSVHLTCGVHTLKGVDFFDSLNKQLATEVLFREDLDTLGGPEVLAAQEATLKKKLIEIVEASSLSDWLEYKNQAHPHYEGIHLGPLPDVKDDTIISLLTRHRGAPAFTKIQEQGDSQVPAAAQRVIDALWDIDAARFSELKDQLGSDYEASTVRAAVDTLIEGGFLEVVQ